MKFRINYRVVSSGHIDIEAETIEDRNYIALEEIPNPLNDPDYYEESCEPEIESIERLVHELIVICYAPGWPEWDQNGAIELRVYDTSTYWKNLFDIDPWYTKHQFIEQCFCILPGGDV